MADIDYKRGDTVPLGARLPTDLTEAAAVHFYMARNGEVLVDARARITDPAEGRVEYQWLDGETDVQGEFEIEWEVTWNDKATETFPKRGRDTVYFHDDIQ